jgi:putative glutamine amidotransferase
VSAPVIGVAWPKPAYVAALEQAGATVRELVAAADPLPSVLDACDGILLTGGPDVDPAAYGDADRHETVEVDPSRDAYELTLARCALDRNLPLFAICRGVQVLNVAAGGTLVQDLPTDRPSAVRHAVREPKGAPVHDVRVTPETRLADLLRGELRPDGQLAVNSRHHQAIRRPAPGFIVSAVAPDDVIEAIERPRAEFCLGVQWHPEDFWGSGEFAGLFSGLVEASRKRKGEKTL